MVPGTSKLGFNQLSSDAILYRLDFCCLWILMLISSSKISLSVKCGPRHRHRYYRHKMQNFPPLHWHLIINFTNHVIRFEHFKIFFFFCNKIKQFLDFLERFPFKYHKLLSKFFFSHNYYTWTHYWNINDYLI